MSATQPYISPFRNLGLDLTADLGKSNGETGWGTIIRVVFFLIFFLAKVATCDNSTSNSRVNSNIVSNIPRISAQISTDSLLRQTVAKRNTTKEERWKKPQFDFVINMIKANQKVKANSMTTNRLLIDMGLDELKKIEDLPAKKRTITSGEIETLKREFKALKAANMY